MGRKRFYWIWVAEGIYRAGISLINKRELIGDGEVISEEMLEEGEKEE